MANGVGGQTVVVTGARGLIGRRLLNRLVRNERVGRLIAVDLAAPSDVPPSPKLEWRPGDVRDARLAEQLEGADAVVHLAFILDPIHNEVTMRSVNVDGTCNVFTSASKAGVRRIVYTSSFVVYGAHPDNEFPLTEDSPLRANPDFSYAEHKLAVERWLGPWVAEHPDVVVTVLRPAIVAGPGVQNHITRQLEMPRPVAVKGYRPPWQFAHVDDVVSAIDHALERDLPGPYNVACEGWVSWEELLELTDTKVLDLPEEVAFALVGRLWRVGLAEAPPGELHYLMYPSVMSVEKLMAAGWRPQHTNRDTLRELHAEHAPYVSLVRGVRLRRRDLKLGAAVGGGMALAAAVRRLRTRRGR